jgi:CBS domain-containing protein
MENPGVSVAKLASEHSIAVSRKENLGSAVETMRKHHLSNLPVVDAEGKLVGALRSVDLADALVGNWKQEKTTE